MHNFFQKYGVVKSVAVMKDRDGNSRGFGFVTFEKHEDAQKAVEELNGTKVEGVRRLVKKVQLQWFNVLYVAIRRVIVSVEVKEHLHFVKEKLRTLWK